MKKNALFLCLFFTSIFCFSQDLKYKEYSYSEFFQLIEEEKDTIFELKDAIIRFNKNTDTLYAAKLDFIEKEYKFFRKEKIIIDKELNLNNVQFLPYYSESFEPSFDRNKTLPVFIGIGFYNMTFLKKVTLTNTICINIKSSTFKKPVIIGNVLNEDLIKIHTYIEKKVNDNGFSYQDALIENNIFNSNFRLDIANYTSDKKLDNYIDIKENVFNGDYTYIRGVNINLFTLEKNIYNSKIRPRIVAEGISRISINKNKFNTWVDLIINAKIHTETLEITENSFSQNVRFSQINFPKETNIDWKQWKGKIFSLEAENDYSQFISKARDSIFKLGLNVLDKWGESSEKIENYLTNGQVQINKYYLEEIKLRYQFYNLYKSVYDIENANLVYTDIKDLETKRSEYLFTQNPSFKTFFKWRINQFLKVFSGYGTEPERAVIFSMYVILLFALVYLLFPNSWDAHGRKRLMHRFEFFQKYLRRNEGIHTIYLEGKQQEISSFNDFKNKLDDEKLELPAFFISWSKPLYNASMFSSKLMTRFLKTTDVLTGKWKDLSPKQKRLKNIQIGFLLTIGLLYDILIKMLNALMLSINTFTTLGFGEIPIKGLPRYLAIIQGFIGWFMLTIFSVSLISQLLN